MCMNPQHKNVNFHTHTKMASMDASISVVSESDIRRLACNARWKLDKPPIKNILLEKLMYF